VLSSLKGVGTKLRPKATTSTIAIATLTSGPRIATKNSSCGCSDRVPGVRHRRSQQCLRPALAPHRHVP